MAAVAKGCLDYSLLDQVTSGLKAWDVTGIFVIWAEFAAMRRVLLVLALAVASAMAGTAPDAVGLDPELAAAAARALGAPPATLARGAATPWAHGARLSRALAGAGFHRALALRLELDVARAPPGAAGCATALLLPLPGGLFADPYQLDDLARRGRGGGARFAVHGPVDLEL